MTRCVSRVPLGLGSQVPVNEDLPVAVAVPSCTGRAKTLNLDYKKYLAEPPERSY